MKIRSTSTAHRLSPASFSGSGCDLLSSWLSHSWVCVALASFALGFFTPTARAESPSSSQLQECRAWAQFYWNWRDTGLVDPEWEHLQFSFPVWQNFNPLLPSIIAFEQLFAARLIPSYALEDLLRDDPAVLAAFRHHTVTGEIITPLSDPPATASHLRLVVLAVQPASNELQEPCVEVSAAVSEDGLYFAASGTAIESNILIGKKKPCPTPVPSPPVLDPFGRTIEDILRDSGLSVPGHVTCLYAEDGGWWWSSPGFDCDDFALAARNYLYWRLRGQFPDAKFRFLLANWWGDGHSMVLVEHLGKFYVIDPQTGRVLGPFDSTTSQEFIDAVWQLMSDGFGVRDPFLPRLTPSESPVHRFAPEPDAWHTDPTQRERVKE